MKTKSTYLRAASLASPTLLLENAEEKTMNAICGQKCVAQLERLSHVGSWAKTFSALLIGQTGWYSTRCKLIWKMRGTKYNRFYFQLRPLTRHTGEIGSGLLPTVTTMDSTGATETEKAGKGDSQNSLTRMALRGQLLFTPKTTDNQIHYKTKNWKGDDLGSQINEIFGTRSRLSPHFVLEMMGFPKNWTELPFQNGETKV